MFWHGNDQEILPGMVLFIHTIVRSRDDRMAQCPGQTYIVTRKGHECLSRMPLDLVANED
jgi:hypothetical protein